MKVAETTVSAKFLTAIPKAIRVAMDLKAGDRIFWVIENSKICVEKSGK